MRIATGLLGIAAALAVAGCGSTSPGATRARALITAYGCGACHTIPGVTGADGKVGPSLQGLAGRRSIAGRLANTPDNLALWIQRPQQIDPGNLMPDLGLGRTQAAEIAAYLDRN